MSSLRTQIFGGLVGGVLTLFYAFAILLQTWQISSWPSVPGTVVQSHFFQWWSFRGGSYFAEIRYRYQVKGVRYEGKRLWSAGYRPSKAKVIAEVMAPLQAGATVKVFYEPGAPDYAVLFRGAHRNTSVPIGVGAACFLWAGWAGLQLQKQKRTARVSRPRSVKLNEPA